MGEEQPGSMDLAGITSASFSMHTRRLPSPPSCSGAGLPLDLAARTIALLCFVRAVAADRTSFTCARERRRTIDRRMRPQTPEDHYAGSCAPTPGRPGQGGGREMLALKTSYGPPQVRGNPMAFPNSSDEALSCNHGTTSSSLFRVLHVPFV